MHAELIAIGSELVLGEIVDTNSAHLARDLRGLGVEVRWMSAVGDDEARIAALVAQAMQRSPIVITTGGLGPTVDDPTRAAIAAAIGQPLEYRPELWEQIQARFARFRRTPTENNRRQAYVPRGARPLENPVGTAPCFIVETDSAAVIALPGVPREMEHMFAHAVAPYLRQRFGLTQVIVARTLRTVGIGESMVDERVADLEALGNPSVGLAAHAGQTDIRITARAASQAEAEALIAPVAEQVRQRLGDFVYGEGQETVEAVVARLLAERGQCLASSEAGTGGSLAGRLSATPEAARIFRGGQITAMGEAADLAAWAERARSGHEADWGLSVALSQSGDARQFEVFLTDGQTPEQRTLAYGGPPAYAPTWASTTALNLLRLRLLRGAP